MAAKPHSTVTDGTSISGGEKFLAYDADEVSGTRSRGFLITTIRAWIESTTTVLMKGLGMSESGSDKGSAFKRLNFIGATVTDAGAGQANVEITGGGSGGTFDPPWTGAVPRALDVRGEDWVSIKDFGVSDGDDVSAELRNAMSQGARQIWFPKGTWKLSNINLANYSAGFVFRGEGRVQTILRMSDGAAGGTKMFHHTGGGTGGQAAWENLQILLTTDPANSPDVVGIDMDAMNNCMVSNVNFFGSSGRVAGDRMAIGVVTNDTPEGGSYNNMMSNCAFQWLKTGVENRSNLTQIFGCEMVACDIGIDNSYLGDALQVVGGRAEGCITGALEKGRHTSYFYYRTEANTNDYAFQTGAIDCSIFGGLTAASSSVLTNADLCMGLHIIANDLGGVTFRSDSLSRPSLFYGPNVLAPSGAVGLVTNPPGVGTHAALVQQGRLVVDNNEWLVWRNAAGDSIVFGMSVDTNDHLNIGSLATVRIGGAATTMGFHGVSPVGKETVTGSRASGAALTDLLTKLANKGIIGDGTSA